MSTALNYRSDRLTHDDYFALEQADDLRYEYLAGEVFAMAGGSESHALIGSNALIALGIALQGKPCRVYNPDMKLYIAAFDKFCYPDLQVLCAEGRRHEKYVEGPALVMEVLSEGTESYDRGLKFEHYRNIPELHHYLLLAQDRPHAELYTRLADGGWRLTEADGLEGALTLALWELELPLAELYRNVDFPPPMENG
jgi:Uma2 family endonuclease